MSWRRSHGATPEPSDGAGAGGTGGGDDPSVPREPTPARGEDVPHSVLDELRQAFTTTPDANDATGTVPIEFTDGFDLDTTFDGTLGLDDLDDLPPAEYDDFTGEPPRPTGSDPARGGASTTDRPIATVSTAPGSGFDDLPPAEPWVLDTPATPATPATPLPQGTPRHRRRRPRRPPPSRPRSTTSPRARSMRSPRQTAPSRSPSGTA